MYVDIPGPQRSTVDPQRVLALLRSFSDVDFFNLQNKYFEDCTDQPTAIISVSVDGRSKQVSNYYGGCEGKTTGPQVQLASLSNEIDAVARTRRWITCDSKCAKDLTQSGLDVNARAPNGDTPLTVAIRKKDFSKMRVLLDAGAKVNFAGGEDTTPLIQAVMMDQENMVRELLARGADANAKDSKGYTALQMTGDENLRRLLVEARRK